jgi:tRNA A-37 threonylcarbamoyl transferase component Bud32
VPDLLTRVQAALADRYRLEREVGAGGMATVYLAQDLRHDRKVAVKVLRPELAAVIGAERFLAEIKLTANLQHPHILPLFDSGEADSFLFYVMPYVEGESLRDRLRRDKQLPVDDAVRTASEVASALDYAHRHGVVHRDIKPENVLLHDGQALVADFGIALAASKASGVRMTETGMSLGTPHYMSPEQAMGEREITARSDVYALGAVLYEMLTGEPPFTGSTAQAVVARVLTESPRPLRPQRHTIPASVEAAVLRALEKLPADRFATAAQFAGALTHPGSVPMATGAAVAIGAAHRGRPVARLAVAGGALMLAALLGAALWTWLGPKPESSVRQLVRFDIQLPRDARPVGAPGSTIAFSPDGSQIVYIGKAPAGQRLYVRRMDRPDPIPIPGSEGGTLPFFSADGQWLGFKQGGKLVKVARAGGPVTPICSLAGIPYGATWTAGDTIIFAADSGIMEVPAAGGSPHLIARPDSGEVFHFPDVLPGGRAVLFGVAGGGTLKLAALIRRTGEVKRLQQPGGYPRYVTGGFVVLSDPSGILSAVPFDAIRLEVTGPARPILDQLVAGPDGDVNLGMSRSGDFAFQASTSEGSRLVLVDRGGVERDAGGADTGYYYTPRLAPDGRRVALLRATEFSLSSRDVWVFDLVQHTRTRVTFDTTAGWPLWTPDGQRIAYTHFPDGSRGHKGNISWVPADGSGPPESLVVQPGQWWASSFEPDGRGFVYSGLTSPQANREIWQVRLEGGTAPRRVLATGFNNAAPSLSPDGRWLAYVADESGRDEVYVRPYPGPGGRWQVSLDGGTEPLWSPTGNEIFYRNGDLMIAAAVRTTTGFEVRGRTRLFTGPYDPAVVKDRNYDVTRDGRTFLMLQRVVGARQAVVVTLNWFDEANRKVRGSGD